MTLYLVLQPRKNQFLSSTCQSENTYRNIEGNILEEGCLKMH